MKQHPPAPVTAYAAPASSAADGLALYIHWPFCEAKCPYCDFNSHVVNRVDQDRWGAAFEVEIERAAKRTRGRSLTSVFFGGGTPSLMSPDTVDRILVAARRVWRFDESIEVTLEANPSSVEADRFRGFVDAGVNRFSIGVQALSDPDLKRLGRLHTVRDALTAIDTARNLIDRISFDLIYARQDQSAAAWREELQQALAMGPEHLSLYQLTIEDGTAFGRRHAAGKLLGLPDQELAAELYEITQELCDSAGMPAYEVSNHARPGRECRHNLTYWRGGDYVGIGPGAHGRLTLEDRRYSTVAASNPMAWLAGVERRDESHEASDPIDAEEQAVEYMMMALRMREGMMLAKYRSLGGTTPDWHTLAALQADGLLWISDDRIGTTPSGRLLLNAILRALV